MSSDSESLFELVNSDVSFAQDEEKILQFWKDIKAFETSLKQSEGKPEFTFYDGPPFATGKPHYGHILAGTIKDVVTRYAHQTGHHVSRRFGWDTHGLPVEYEIDKKLGITGPEDVMKMGIGAYNEECRSIVMTYAGLWREVVERMGRWIDFENDYKTLDTPFMESVWWVFSELYKKGYVYEGFKVMPFSTGCATPLSNFEAGQNYKDVQDPAVTVSFPLKEDPTVSFIAWTTTPWTLPSNLALCVNPKLTYVKVKDMKRDKIFIMAESRLGLLYKSARKAAPGSDAPKKKKKKKKKNKQAGKSLFTAGETKEVAPAADEEDSKIDGPEYEVLESFLGATLEGKQYEPLFPYFASMAEDGAFKVLCDDYVTDSDGTGVVHNAPGHGEDDYRVCLAGGVIKRGAAIVCPVNASGKYTSDVTDYAGMYIKDANRPIIKRLQTEGRMVEDSQITHAYPHCWRSNTPLVQKAVPSWFVNVPSIKEKLLANNDKTYWVPSFVKEKRFHNWLADATDWSVSRDRFWGTPIPIWRSDDGEEIVVIESVADLETRSGVTGITDLHRHNIDHIEIPSSRGAEFGTLKRINQVFDCWFESGSMPYAQAHYPFENKEKFEKGFPADFIAEGLDQTRGWFYTLMVLSTALFDKPAFQNLIVNGLVLAEDGSKMSKSKQNYDPPLEVVEQFGADAVRLYLINSPVVRAEPLKFQTSGVRDVVKTIFIPWQNTYRLFCEQARRMKIVDGIDFEYRPNIHAETDNLMDKWILASLQSLIGHVHEEMKGYRLYTVTPRLVDFIVQLSNWYIRLNKNRFKGLVSVEDTKTSLATLYEVLYKLCRVMAPFTPFLVESMFSNLKAALPEEERHDSVHYSMLPTVNEAAVNTDIERSVSSMQSVVEVGRVARERTTLGWRTPSPKLVIVHADDSFVKDLEQFTSYIKEELNVYELEFSTDVSSVGSYKADPNFKPIGQRLRGDSSRVCGLIRELGHADVVTLDKQGELKLDDGKETIVYKSDVTIRWEFTGDADKYEVQTDSNTGVMVLLQKQLTQECKDEGVVRDVMGAVQRMRKSSGLSSEDRVEAYFTTESASLHSLLTTEKWRSFISTKVEYKLEAASDAIAEEKVQIGDDELVVALKKLAL